MTKEILLTQGKVTLVDDELYEELSRFKWRVFRNHNMWYVWRTTGRDEGSRNILMHRQILDAPDGVSVDHRDRDGLNNQRANLRLCTPQENHFNRGVPSNNTSGYKGVDWHKERQKWRARVAHSGKRFEMGHFESELEAARAYDIKARELFGEFARLNFPEPEG